MAMTNFGTEVSPLHGNWFYIERVSKRVNSEEARPGHPERARASGTVQRLSLGRNEASAGSAPDPNQQGYEIVSVSRIEARAAESGLGPSEPR